MTERTCWPSHGSCPWQELPHPDSTARDMSSGYNQKIARGNHDHLPSHRPTPIDECELRRAPH